MTPFWSDDHLTLYGGDCRSVLAELPAESVHCVVTSPPYWGLRDYGTASWEGGDEACDHAGPAKASTRSTLKNDGRPAELVGQNDYERAATVPYRETCARCGARRIDSQLGLEPTPEAYVENMVAVFREVRRVLRADGTLWLNLGDSFGDKQLQGIPWRVAFALQADGWYLRSDIIWSKPNPMPESVTDRPTKAHEYLFLLSKSPRYYFDADAVREPDSGQDAGNGFAGRQGGARQTAVDGGEGSTERWRASKKPDGWATHDGGHGSFHKDGREAGEAALIRGGRNLRSVWTIATEPYPGAHFATFPRKLVEPCVKAGTSERGVCPECGAPWVRVVERGERVQNGHTAASPPKYEERRHEDFGSNAFHTGMQPGMAYARTTTGWRADCTCLDPETDFRRPTEPVPAVVLDPFAGSGTTLFVAQALGRRGVGIDLNPEYLKQALARNAQTPLGLVG